MPGTDTCLSCPSHALPEQHDVPFCERHATRARCGNDEGLLPFEFSKNVAAFRASVSGTHRFLVAWSVNPPLLLGVMTPATPVVNFRWINIPNR